MNMTTDPAFVAAEMEYRYSRDHVTTARRTHVLRDRLATIWHRSSQRVSAIGHTDGARD